MISLIESLVKGPFLVCLLLLFPLVAKALLGLDTFHFPGKASLLLLLADPRDFLFFPNGLA